MLQEQCVSCASIQISYNWSRLQVAPTGNTHELSNVLLSEYIPGLHSYLNPVCVDIWKFVFGGRYLSMTNRHLPGLHQLKFCLDLSDSLLLSGNLSFLLWFL